MTMTELTAITESLDGDEVQMLTFMLDRVRAQFAWKCGGLDEAGLRATLPPSTLTLGGLLKHCAACEERMLAVDLGVDGPAPDWIQLDGGEDWEFSSAAQDSAEDLYAIWTATVERSRTAWAAVLADGGLDRPSRKALPDGTHPNLRRVYVDLIEHYLRHTGHADLIRESVDGLVGEDPPQPTR
jgi:hypothetical protein